MRAILLLAIPVVGLITSCDRVFGLSERTDASPSGDGHGDVPPTDAPCTVEFNTGAVSPIGPFQSGETDPMVSANGLELFYTRIVAGDLEIFQTTRTSTAAPFPIGSPVLALNSTNRDGDPTITQDGLTLLFTSSRPPGAGRVWQARRTNLGAEWGPPSLLTTVSAASIDVSADGLTLYAMNGDTDLSELYRFQRSGIDQPFEQGMRIGTGARFPSVDAAGLTVYFHGGPPNTFDLYRMTRNSPNLGFQDPELILLGAGDPDLSFDGQTLVFTYQGGLASIRRACVAP